jgi:hypothetical protein
MSTTLKVVAVLLSLTNPAFAFGLTDADYEYLATQNVPRDSSVLRGLSPKEQENLHGIIQHDGAARAKNVADALAAFQDLQRWEQAHPGQLWGRPKR